MEQEEYWNQFASSGKVADYLKYRQNATNVKKQAEFSEGREYGQDSNGNRDGTDSILPKGI